MHPDFQGASLIVGAEAVHPSGISQALYIYTHPVKQGRLAAGLITPSLTHPHKKSRMKREFLCGRKRWQLCCTCHVCFANLVAGYPMDNTNTAHTATHHLPMASVIVGAEAVGFEPTSPFSWAQVSNLLH